MEEYILQAEESKNSEQYNKIIPALDSDESQNVLKIIDKNQIKLVIWDLDNTLWNGMLAEEENIFLFKTRFNIIKQLNNKGIVNSICSNNDFNKAKKFLEINNLWDIFVFPKIDFLPKGQTIKSLLKEMHLRAQNAVFVDDNISNLEEVLFYNSGIKVLNANECEKFLSKIIKESSDNTNLSRFNQYKQLDKRTQIQKNFSSNNDFLKQSNIRLKFLDVTDDLFERLFELSERTNQLNFTKNRMSKEELSAIIKNPEIKTQLIHAVDNYCDYGIIGFYSIKNHELINFVFSCRIINMGIEQFVYEYLNFPNLKIIGEVASEISKCKKIDYIKITVGKNENENENIDKILNDNSRINIFAIGACDLYHPIAYFSMPNQYFKYECNVFLGNERGVNVGTEYIRSQMDMTNEEKEFCKKHFHNYTRYNVFKSKIFENHWDYIIMSFHDDMIYKIYHHKQNSNLRVTLSPAPIFGLTSIINIDKNKTKWLEDNFTKGEYITPERFKENLLYIANTVSEKAKIILINGPELDYFRDTLPSCPEAREQILKINQVIKEVCKEYSNKFVMVDINKVIKSQKDVTNYIFHLKADTAYNLFIEIISTIINHFPSSKPQILNKVLNNRNLYILSENTIQAKNAFYNLKLGNNNPVEIINLNSFEKYKLNKKDSYIVVADCENYKNIREVLIDANFKPINDFIQLNPITYKKIWKD